MSDREEGVQEKRDEVFTDSNRCKDFDDDCADLGYPAVHCWAHDPCQGWCPLLQTKADQ